MKIKVCGLKEPANLKAVAALQPDYLGFICYDRSPRFINDLQAEALAGLKPYKTGVFVNESLERVIEVIEKYNLDAAQLHGSEEPAYCDKLKDRVQILKAFGIDESFDFEQLRPYENHVNYFLFDTKTEQHGGSGKTFNWTVLNKYDLDIPFFLSGGLSLDNLEQVVGINHPQFYGVDLNSRFETAPGIKDIDKLTKAFELLRQTATK